MTPSGIKPSIFRLAVQCLQLLYHIDSWQFSKSGRICQNARSHVQKFYLFCQQTDISIKLTNPMTQRRFVVAHLVLRFLRHLLNRQVRENFKNKPPVEPILSYINPGHTFIAIVLIYILILSSHLYLEFPISSCGYDV